MAETKEALEAAAREAFIEESGQDRDFAANVWDSAPDDQAVKVYWRRIVGAAFKAADATRSAEVGEPDSEGKREVTVSLSEDEILVVMTAEKDYESGDWEHSLPGYDYVAVRSVNMVAETLTDESAALASFELEGGDLFPDGWCDLPDQMEKGFRERRARFEEKRARATRTQDGSAPFFLLGGSDNVDADGGE